MAKEARELWDAEAAAFDEAADHGLRDPQVKKAWADLLLPLIPGRGRRVADLGCGTGTLSALLAAEGGHRVTGVDFSPEMLRHARGKSQGVRPRPDFIEADAAAPPLEPGVFDVVLARHVLWAMPDPTAALARWIDLLTPTGILLLVEGRWHTEVGVTAAETSGMLHGLGRRVEMRLLQDPQYWGRAIRDERYLIISEPLLGRPALSLS